MDKYIDDLIEEVTDGIHPEETFKKMIMMADTDPQVCHLLYLVLARFQNPRYYPDAMRLLLAGSEKNWPHIDFDLGTIYELGLFDQEIQYQEALSAYRKGAENHDPNCSQAMARICITGKIVTRNPESAAYWYERSYEDGNLKAALYLGNLYNPNNHILSDVERAFYWYEQGVKNKVADCYVMMGTFYDNEEITEVPYNLKMAHALYMEGAKLGSVDGYLNAGLDYLYGSGCPINMNLAVQYLTKAADGGNKGANDLLQKLGKARSRYGGNYVKARRTGQGYSNISGTSFTGRVAQERQEENRRRQESMQNQQLLQAAATASGVSGYMNSDGSYMTGFDNADLIVMGDSVYNTETGDFMKYDADSGLLWNYGQKEVSIMGESGDIMYDYSDGNVSFKLGNTVHTEKEKK